MQISLRTLFGLLGCTAVFCVAMLNAGPVWVLVLRGAAFMSLLFAMMAVWYRHDAKRAFWVGYLHGGGAYAALTLYALGGLGQNPVWNDRQIASGELATAVYSWLPASKRQAPMEPRVVNMQWSKPRAIFAPYTSAAAPPEFRYIFHAAFIVLCGWLGGLVAVWLFKTKGGPVKKNSVSQTTTGSA
jgi:hypothetical protein